MSKKKDFKIENPALKFLDTDNTQYTHNTHNTYNTPETKSKRLNLLIYPSLLENLKKIATMQRRSVNELINDVLTEYAEQQAETIQRYNDTF